MLIVLIRPSIPENAPLPKTPSAVHIGLASVAAVLEKDGRKVAVIDNHHLSEDNVKVAESIKAIKPDLVGINCDLVTIGNVTELTNLIQKLDIPVVVGGPEVNIHPEEAFKRIKSDFAIYGEGEETILDLCNYLEARKSSTEQLKNISGLLFRDDNGTIVINPPRPLIDNMDKLPFLAMGRFPLDKYRRKDRFLDVCPVDSLCTSRGCPFRCAFCSNETVWGKKYRTMSPKRIVDEIEHMMREYGTKGIYFTDDNFTLDSGRLTALCEELLKRKTNIKWICESRVDIIDNQLLKKMKSSGCDAIWFGVESGVQRVLDILKKDITLEQIEKAFALCKKNEITTGASIMLGIPGETKKEAWQTIRFIKKINPRFALVNIFLGIPGSEIYEEIISKNLIYKRYEGLVLANTEEMTWRQKQRLAFLAKLIFSLRLSEMLRELKERGVINYIREKITNALRLLRK